MLITAINISEATIKVSFTYDEFNQYAASVSDQEFSRDESFAKVLGKNLPGKKSSDVKVIDCADKGNRFDVYPPMLSSIFYEAEVLLLQNTGLKRLVHDSFVYTGKIKIMMFAKDNFDIEPAVFKNCTDLEVLKFDDMDLSDINVGAFEGISNLKILAMKKCQLTRIDPELLEPLENLLELHITENQMKVAPIIAIQRMTRLKVLNLSGNKLTHLHDDLFKNKNFLEFVDVSKNEIYEIERDILIHWPDHATINMEGNTCIDKKFDHIGTDSLTISDVASALMPCFNEDSKEDSSDSEENSSEKSIAVEKSGESSTEKGHDGSKSIEVKQKHESKESKSSETSEDTTSEQIKKHKKESKSSETSEETKHDGEINEHSKKIHKDKGNEKLQEMPKESKSSESVEGKIKSIEIKESKSSESLSIERIISKSSHELSKEKLLRSSEEKLASHKEKTSKSEEKDDKKSAEIKKDTKELSNEEVVATISPFEFVEQNESPANVTEIPSSIPEGEVTEIEELEGEEKAEGEVLDDSTAKKKKKVKKIKKTTEAPSSTAQFSELPEPALPYLHSYEQAWCRFFIDAKNNYNCVLENVTSEIKRINFDHISGYDNSKVHGLFLLHSVLVRLPKIFFDTFENLQHLSAENTNIKQLDEDTVKDGCGRLKSLSLKDCKVRRLERHALKECETLEELDLTGNPMEYIEGDIFNYNPKLSITMASLKIVAPALTSF